MNCFPHCKVMLPKIGEAYISTKLDTCKSPAILSLGVISDGKRSVSNFLPRNQWEYRRSGSQYWPLELQVRFTDAAAEGVYYAEACINSIKTGDTKCFMSEFIEGSKCKSHDNNNVFSTTVLYVIVAMCLLMIFVGGIAIVYRYYVSHKSKDKRQTSNNTQKVPKYYVHKASDIVPPLSPLKESVYSHGIQGNGYLNEMGDMDDSGEWSDAEGDDPKCNDSLSEHDPKYFFGRDFMEDDKNGSPRLNQT